MTGDCALCEARAHALTVPASTRDAWTWRNPSAFAIQPLTPVNPGHLLVVTRRHHAYLWELSALETTYVAELQRQLARWLIDHGAHGVNVLHASGDAAGQSVLHTHWHVVPRYREDCLDLWLRDRHLGESVTGRVEPWITRSS